MASKHYLFGCMACGEYVKGNFKDVIGQTESHMCTLVDAEQKKDSLLQLCAAVNEEVTKLANVSQGKIRFH